MATKPIRRSSAPVTRLESAVDLNLTAAGPGVAADASPPNPTLSSLTNELQLAGAAAGSGPVLPTQPDAESAVAWGEDTGSNDSQLAAEVPPHW
ncbi:MAG: hypothetical protein FWG16_06250 [Micrococcales bacterium]|nr:hypothetical protein [Micrococcales bacterium]